MPFCVDCEWPDIVRLLHTVLIDNVRSVVLSPQTPYKNSDNSVVKPCRTVYRVLVIPDESDWGSWKQVPGCVKKSRRPQTKGVTQTFHIVVFARSVRSGSRVTRRRFWGFPLRITKIVADEQQEFLWHFDWAKYAIFEWFGSTVRVRRKPSKNSTPDREDLENKQYDRNITAVSHGSRGKSRRSKRVERETEVVWRTRTQLSILRAGTL